MLRALLLLIFVYGVAVAQRLKLLLYLIAKCVGDFLKTKQVWVGLLNLGEPSSHAVLRVVTGIFFCQMSGSFGEIVVG